MNHWLNHHGGVVIAVCLTLLVVAWGGYHTAARWAGRDAPRVAPMSPEVKGHLIREALDAELAELGLAVDQLERDALEELWEASP